MMFKAKKAISTIALINSLFATGNQTVAEPVGLLQGIVMEEYVAQANRKLT
ncbi:MAG: hypothetical protein HQK65_02560 [Desulfamplus sp.]|nr:hypothetical protein [Desulfamplus sp.]